MVKSTGQTATDTKTPILDAADEIFVRRGIDLARMQEIADHGKAKQFASVSADQFFITLVGSCLYPFAARR